MQKVNYLLALHTVNGLGAVRLNILLNYFTDPQLIWEARESELQGLRIPKSVIQNLVQVRKQLDPENYVHSLIKRGIKWVTISDNDYPKLLKQLYDPPVVLYYKGEILPSDERSIAIVGTRQITSYGRFVTEKFTKELVDYGFTIVSGLARGVDTQAHLATIKNNGRTVAVFGGGLNNIYPPENSRLAEEIINGFGAVISEFPPDASSLPGNFPMRNRIISGLSLGVVVAEAALNSGSLITAKLALEQGREVFAIPGPINSALSQGPIGLIREGAKIVSETSDILIELGVN